MSALLVTQALALVCTLQSVSADGSAYVGPEYRITLDAPAHSLLVREDAELHLTGAEPLALAANWKTEPNFHGSVQVLPIDADSPLSGLLIPNNDGTFSIFWANNKRLKSNGAPITEISGTCSPIVEADDRKAVK